jgi:hypothetical protein
VESQNEIVGRSWRDFIPPAVDQLFSYYLHREMLASQATSVSFEMIMSRLDGSLFKCTLTLTVFVDPAGTHMQEMVSILLETVEDLTQLVPPLDKPLPKTKPPMSLEVDYPDPEEDRTSR